MAITVEELEIVVRGNIQDAVNKISQLKVQINNTLNRKMQEAKPQIQSVSNAVTTTTNKMATQYRILGKQIELQESKIESLRQKLEAGGKQNVMDRTAMSMRSAEIQLEKMNLRAREYEAKMSGMSAPTKKASESFNKLSQSTKKASKSLKDFISHSKKAKKTTVPFAKSIIKFGTLMKTMLMRLAIRQIFKAVSEGTQDMAIAIPRVNATMSAMKTNLLSVRNGITVALYPAIQALMPLFNALASAVINAGNAISQFFATITGQQFFIKANKSVTDYAASVKKAGKEAKNALAPFDQLNVLAKQEASGGEAGMPAPAEMFQEVKVTGKFDDIKKLFDTKQFEEIGKNIAKSINKSINKMNLGKAASNFANKLNAFNEIAYGFASNFHWETFGIKLSEGINGFFSAFNWSKFAENSSEWAKGLINTLSGFILGTDWKLIGESFATALSNIDYTGIVKSMALMFGRALGGLALLLYGFIEDACMAIGRYFAEKTDEAGGNVVLGLLKGIVDGIVGIVEWLWVNLVEPIINGVKEMFGIHSPSTVFAEIGGFLIEGLKVGILDKWNSIKKALTDFWDNIKKLVGEKWNSIVDWFTKNITPVFTVKFWSDKFSSIYQGMKSTMNAVIGVVETAVNWIIDKINTLSWKIPKWVPKIGGERFGFDFAPIEIPRLKNGGVLKSSTLINAGEYAGASSNPEIVTPENLMREVFLSSQIPVVNAIEEMSDRVVEAFKALGFDIELDGRSLVRSIIPYQNSEKARIGSAAFVR